MLGCSRIMSVKGIKHYTVISKNKQLNAIYVCMLRIPLVFVVTLIFKLEKNKLLVIKYIMGIFLHSKWLTPMVIQVHYSMLLLYSRLFQQTCLNYAYTPYMPLVRCHNANACMPVSSLPSRNWYVLIFCHKVDRVSRLSTVDYPCMRSYHSIYH